MFDWKRYISQEEILKIDNLVDFLLDAEVTADQILEIKADPQEIGWRIRMWLWILSVRNWGRYKQALNKSLSIKNDN